MTSTTTVDPAVAHLHAIGCDTTVRDGMLIVVHPDGPSLHLIPEFTLPQFHDDPSRLVNNLDTFEHTTRLNPATNGVEAIDRNGDRTCIVHMTWLDPTEDGCADCLFAKTSRRTVRLTLDGAGREWVGQVDAKVTWNGWACPRFDTDTATAILEWMREQDADEWGFDESDEQWPMDLDGMVAVGAHAWTWEVVA